jgi:hypothetical protein
MTTWKITLGPTLYSRIRMGMGIVTWFEYTESNTSLTVQNNLVSIAGNLYLESNLTGELYLGLETGFNTGFLNEGNITYVETPFRFSPSLFIF